MKWQFDKRRKPSEFYLGDVVLVDMGLLFTAEHKVFRQPFSPEVMSAEPVLTEGASHLRLCWPLVVESVKCRIQGIWRASGLKSTEKSSSLGKVLQTTPRISPAV